MSPRIRRAGVWYRECAGFEGKGFVQLVSREAGHNKTGTQGQNVLSKDKPHMSCKKKRKQQINSYRHRKRCTNVCTWGGGAPIITCAQRQHSHANPNQSNACTGCPAPGKDEKKNNVQALSRPHSFTHASTHTKKRVRFRCLRSLVRLGFSLPRQLPHRLPDLSIRQGCVLHDFVRVSPASSGQRAPGLTGSTSMTYVSK